MRCRQPVGRLVDIGIGCGQFVEAWPNAYGYDINPAAIRWLDERGRYFDPYAAQIESACFWDSLEHIQAPTPILQNVRRYVFIAMPIFRDAEHILASKHFRPTEHYWYFTESGLRHIMARHGFECVERRDDETRLGREDIVSFAFRRR